MKETELEPLDVALDTLFKHYAQKSKKKPEEKKKEEKKRLPLDDIAEELFSEPKAPRRQYVRLSIRKKEPSNGNAR